MALLSSFHKKLWTVMLVVAAAVLPMSMRAAQAAKEQPKTLTNWQTALSQFQKAGAYIAQKKYAEARAELISCATTLPEPYVGLANQFLVRLDSVLKQLSGSDDAVRSDALAELCAQMRAYEAASQLKASAPTSS